MTARELVTMAEARSQHDWAQTSELLALLANVHRRPGARVFTAADFNPHHLPQRAPAALPKGNIQALKAVFVDQQPAP